MSVAAPFGGPPGDQERLSALRRSSVEAGLAQRARIILLAAEGVPNETFTFSTDPELQAKVLDVLKTLVKTHPRAKLHVVADNYAAHKHAKVKAWLAQYPRVTMPPPGLHTGGVSSTRREEQGPVHHLWS